MSQNDKMIFKVFVLLLFCVTCIHMLLSPEDIKSTAKPLSKSSQSVQIIDIADVIMSSKKTVAQLDKARKDKNVSAILIRINSPGGAVAPSQEIYEEILKIREEKLVVATMGSMAASGGYYIASACNYIFANAGTLTGSIGVVMQMPVYKDLMNKVGVSMRTITAGELKAAGNPFADMSNKEYKYFQALVDETHQQFISDVAKARNTEIDSIRPYAEGEIFTGSMAYKYGLVDSIGTESDARNYIIKTKNLPENTSFNEVKQPSKFMEMLEEGNVKSIIAPNTAKSGLYFIANELI